MMWWTRMVFAEIVRLIRACWRIYFESRPFEFREGDISRSFVEEHAVGNSTGIYLDKVIKTTGQLFVKRVLLCNHAGIALNPLFYFRIERNGDIVAEFNGLAWIPVYQEVNLVFGPGEFRFFSYNASGLDQDMFVGADCWERNEDDIENRLRALSPAQD
jgi:hypothetical protein